MTQTLDISDLSEESVRTLEKMANQLRVREREKRGHADDVVSLDEESNALPTLTPAQKSLHWRSMVKKYAVSGPIIDDSREAIYRDDRS